jgi:hypothetical protein
MTRAEVVDWLGRRRPIPPDALRIHLEQAVRDRPAALPEHLAQEGAELLRQVVAASPAGRERALDLLAADALVTYAFEAQAELDVLGLEALAERVRRLGAER